MSANVGRPPVTLDLVKARELLAGVVRDFPFPENAYEPEYLRKHLVRYRDSCDLIAAHCPREAPLLGVGAEPGHIEILLKAFYGFQKITGLSYRASPEFTRRMATFDIPVIECDVERDPIPEGEGTFRSVVFLEVMEHMFTGVPHALAEMRRVLAPGGALVLSTPNLAQFRNRIKLLKGKTVNWPLDGSKMFFQRPVHLRHNREYTAREVSYLLREAGFLIDKVRYKDYSPRRMMKLFNSLAPGFRSTMFFVARRPA
jgi:SAM-dependent methyltransferase